MILQLAESRSAVTQILQFEEKRVKKRMSGAKLLDKLRAMQQPWFIEIEDVEKLSESRYSCVCLSVNAVLSFNFRTAFGISGLTTQNLKPHPGFEIGTGRS